MAKTVGGRIILDEEESRRLWQDILHPDLEAIKKRDALLEGVKKWKITKLGNGSTILEIPDLKFPDDLFSKNQSEEKIVKSAEPKSDSEKLQKIKQILQQLLIVWDFNKKNKKKNRFKPVKNTSRQDIYEAVLRVQKISGVTNRLYPDEWED